MSVQLVHCSEIIGAYTETTWQRVTSSLHDCNTTSLHHNYSASYHALLLKLLLVDMDHNCTTTGFEVHTCTVTTAKKN